MIALYIIHTNWMPKKTKHIKLLSFNIEFKLNNICNSADLCEDDFQLFKTLLMLLFLSLIELPLVILLYKKT